MDELENNGSSEKPSGICSHVMMTSQIYSWNEKLRMCQHIMQPLGWLPVWVRHLFVLGKEILLQEEPLLLLRIDNKATINDLDERRWDKMQPQGLQKCVAVKITNTLHRQANEWLNHPLIWKTYITTTQSTKTNIWAARDSVPRSLSSALKPCWHTDPFTLLDDLRLGG